MFFESHFYLAFVLFDSINSNPQNRYYIAIIDSMGNIRLIRRIGTAKSLPAVTKADHVSHTQIYRILDRRITTPDNQNLLILRAVFKGETDTLFDRWRNLVLRLVRFSHSPDRYRYILCFDTASAKHHIKIFPIFDNLLYFRMGSELHRVMR